MKNVEVIKRNDDDGFGDFWQFIDVDKLEHLDAVKAKEDIQPMAKRYGYRIVAAYDTDEPKDPNPDYYEIELN